MDDLDMLLDRIAAIAREGERVSVARIRDSLGVDVFGPALLFLGILALSPIGDIPGAPSLMSIVILIVASQLMAGRQEIWLPRFVARREIKSAWLERAVAFARRPFQLLARVFRPRLVQLTDGLCARMVGGACALLALTLPPLEVVPFAATLPSTAITVFGLGLVTRDGLLILAALLVFGASVVIVAVSLLLSGG